MSPQEIASTAIGRSVKIRGEVKGSEDLMVDGQVEGTITLSGSKLTIGPHAEVEANISARDVIVVGRVKGDVQASGRVELRKGCDLVGNIVTDRFSIEENAVFHGNVELLRQGDGSKPEPAAVAAASHAAKPPLIGAPAKK